MKSTIQLSIVGILCLAAGCIVAESESNSMDADQLNEPTRRPLNDSEIAAIWKGGHFSHPLGEQGRGDNQKTSSEDQEGVLRFCDPNTELITDRTEDFIFLMENNLRWMLWKLYQECSVEGFQLGDASTTSLRPGNFSTIHEKIQALLLTGRAIRSVDLFIPSSNDTAGDITKPLDRSPRQAATVNDVTAALGAQLRCRRRCGDVTTLCAAECPREAIIEEVRRNEAADGRSSSGGQEEEEGPGLTECIICLGAQAGECLKCI